jgi:diguanylate cyclase (GGDEF)-like protein
MTPIEEPEDEDRRDKLTQLLNRREWDRALAETIGASPGRPWGVLMIDVDHLLAFNQEYGHRAGDLALVKLASRFAEVIGSNGDLFRVGGDEFVAMLPNATPDVACDFAKCVCEQVSSEPFDFEVPEMGTITLTTSIGVACAPDHGKTADAVVCAADEALYRSKRNGRGQWTLATS